jgi:hypothetical protein
MNKRRTLLKAASLTPILLAGRSFAATPSGDPSRVALVIGNNAYAQAPLDNPVNDARAVGELLQRANFNVDLVTDASREVFLAAIEKFGDAVAKSDSKLALFYYAGHGAQVSWKNYLLPVDATVRSPQDLEARCIELGRLLGRAGQTTGKTLIVILDACRNNPFGPDYEPEQKGLSQFDAPVGSLLAYATAPGRVASDGGGQHGLYTENLLREFSSAGTSIEDAFKRVRLNVRLGSDNSQIPWESTSLEESVFLFPTRKKLDEAELEKLLEEELATWERIKASKQVEDWAGYLRAYPNGKFSEIAQIRLNRLLAPPPPVVPIFEAKSATRPDLFEETAPQRPQMMEAKTAEITAAAPAASRPPNPYSAGTHALGRNYKLGDRIAYRVSDNLTAIEQKTLHLSVTLVDPDADRVEFNHGMWVCDTSGNLQKTGRLRYALPVQMFPAELQIGKKWTTRFAPVGKGLTYDLEMRIPAREIVQVPAGEFNAFRIEGRGWAAEGQSIHVVYWVVPGLNAHYVKREFTVRKRSGAFARTERHELVAFRQ